LRAITNTGALGERTITIDCDVIQADGGTRTAAITGAYVALHDCLSLLKTGKMISSWPLEDSVAAISVGIVDGVHLMDLCYKEDSSAEVDFNVVMTGRGRFVELQGTAETKTFGQEDLSRIIELARRGIESLTRIQAETLKE
jgi:ribonuclease PH